MPPRSAPTSQLFGHPRGLAVLFGTEMWERFSYYGMRALLVLYMVRFLLRPDQIDRVWGLPEVRRFIENLTGPLGTQAFASTLYGLYIALVYLTPLLGGYLADRWLGRRRTVLVGIVLMAVGHFMMAAESLFLPALLVLILGIGAFKPNVTTQIGALYATGDRRRDSAYAIFYVGINLGAFLSPLVCGTLGETVGWHAGFAAAGVGMLVCLVIYLWGGRDLPAEAPVPRLATATSGSAPPLAAMTSSEWKTVATLLCLCLLTASFWATYEQQGNTIALWADENTDRTIDLGVWSGTIPTTWFQSFNPFIIFGATPLLLALWRRQGKREPATITKLGLGCLGPALANLLMAFAAWQAGDGKASWLWLLAYFVIITIGELYLSPVGLSLVSKAAPKQIASTMMGVWFLSVFLGNFMSGWLGAWWSTMDKVTFFLMIAAISGSAAVLILLIRKPLQPFLNDPSGL